MHYSIIIIINYNIYYIFVNNIMKIKKENQVARL